MKILHITPAYLPAVRYGGPIQSVHQLCKSLVRQGHDVHVFTTNLDGTGQSKVSLEEPVNVEGVKVWYFHSSLRRLYFSPSMQRALSAEVKKFDLLHLHSIFLWPTWAGARAAKKAGILYIISPRGMLVKKLIERKSTWVKLAWIHLIEKHNLENASAVHFTSSLEEKEAREFGLKLPPSFVVPNGVDLEPTNDLRLLPQVEAVLKKKPFLLFLGRINWKKGLDRLIPAMSYVPNIHLVVVGNDEENYQPVLEKLAVTNGVRERITFTGPVYGQDKAALLKTATLFVLPSYSENFGNAVLEAMAAGRPVVVTPEVGLAEEVEKAGAGWVVQGDPKILGEALRNILNDPDELKKRGLRGQELVKQKFTWDIVAKQMEEAYTQILSWSKK